MPGKATVGERGAAPQLHDSLVFTSLVGEGNAHGTVEQSAASLSLCSSAIAVEQPGLAQELDHTEAHKRYPGTLTWGEGTGNRN